MRRQHARDDRVVGHLAVDLLDGAFRSGQQRHQRLAPRKRAAGPAGPAGRKRRGGGGRVGGGGGTIAAATLSATALFAVSVGSRIGVRLVARRGGRDGRRREHDGVGEGDEHSLLGEPDAHLTLQHGTGGEASARAVQMPLSPQSS